MFYLRFRVYIPYHLKKLTWQVLLPHAPLSLRLGCIRVQDPLLAQPVLPPPLTLQVLSFLFLYSPRNPMRSMHVTKTPNLVYSRSTSHQPLSRILTTTNRTTNQKEFVPFARLRTPQIKSMISEWGISVQAHSSACVRIAKDASKSSRRRHEKSVRPASSRTLALDNL
jgi:hypothetical protein